MPTLIDRGIQKIKRDFNRSRKHLLQNFQTPIKDKQVLFIVGAQRSGTNMLLKLFDQIAWTRTYNEDNYLAFSKQLRLKDREQILPLLKGNAHCFVFKPILDLQLLPQLLADFPNAKAIWIFRHFHDVSNSAKRNWQTAQRHIIKHIATQENDFVRWYCENLQLSDRELIRSFYSEKLTEEEAGVLKWYLRNQFYFSLGINQRKDVLLLEYEELVKDPTKELKKIETFIDASIPDTAANHIFTSSIRKHQFPTISQSIQNLAQGLHENLQSAKQKAHSKH